MPKCAEPCTLYLKRKPCPFHISLVKLTNTEIAENFPPGTRQLKSSNTLVIESNASQMITKISSAPFNPELYQLILTLSEAAVISDRMITPKFERISGIRSVIKYGKVPHSPLTAEEASKCLLSFIQSVNKSLQALHYLGYAHNDVRLENICFNTNREAVLIDLDRCSFVTERPPIKNVDSCMYQYPSGSCTAGQSDYIMQLGWMVAWVIDFTATDYHNRTFDGLEARVKDDEFVRKLLKEGAYDEDLLLTSYVNSFGNESLQEILQRRADDSY